LQNIEDIIRILSAHQFAISKLNGQVTVKVTPGSSTGKKRWVWFERFWNAGPYLRHSEN